MLTSTAQYQATLPYPHKRQTFLDVYQEGVQVASITDLTFSDGSVRASLTSRVTRTAPHVLRHDFPGDVNAFVPVCR
jgi:hypothetical protein